MDTPKPVADVTKGVSKAVSLQTIVFVAVVFVVVMMLIKYFTRQELVTVEEDGEQKTMIKSSLSFNKKAA